jgi:hypothetical protein
MLTNKQSQTKYKMGISKQENRKLYQNNHLFSMPYLFISEKSVKETRKESRISRYIYTGKRWLGKFYPLYFTLIIYPTYKFKAIHAFSFKILMLFNKSPVTCQYIPKLLIRRELQQTFSKCSNFVRLILWGNEVARMKKGRAGVKWCLCSFNWSKYLYLPIVKCIKNNVKWRAGFPNFQNEISSTDACALARVTSLVVLANWMKQYTATLLYLDPLYLQYPIGEIRVISDILAFAYFQS